MVALVRGRDAGEGQSGAGGGEAPVRGMSLAWHHLALELAAIVLDPVVDLRHALQSAIT